MPFAALPDIPEDPIFGIAQLARQAGPNVIDASIGIVLDDDRHTVTFPSVRAAAKRYAESFGEGDFAYPPLAGLPPYLSVVHDLVFSTSRAKCACIATAGGTGALALLLRLLRQIQIDDIVFPVPAWANHLPLIQGAGLNAIEVPYLREGQPTIQPILDALARSKKPVAVLLQAGCHNPTGKDLTFQQWTAIADAFVGSKHILLLDFAYQGFANDVDLDAQHVRMLAEKGVPLLVAWSGAKNHCLYGLRAGLAFAMGPDATLDGRIERHLMKISRQLYSGAPSSGQRILTIVQQEFAQQWRSELADVRKILITKRIALATILPPVYRAALQGHGLFAQLPLSPAQVVALRNHGIFLTLDGRMNLAGIPANRLDEFAMALKKVM